MNPHRRLLIVEDHQDTRVMLGRLLRKEGYEVVATSSICEAQKACDELSFDICICDLSLKDGTGCDLMRDLKARYHIAGIACSGFEDPAFIQQARDAGFSEYLVKPVNLDAVLASINRGTGDEHSSGNGGDRHTRRSTKHDARMKTLAPPFVHTCYLKSLVPRVDFCPRPSCTPGSQGTAR